MMDSRHRNGELERSVVHTDATHKFFAVPTEDFNRLIEESNRCMAWELDGQPAVIDVDVLLEQHFLLREAEQAIARLRQLSERVPTPGEWASVMDVVAKARAIAAWTDKRGWEDKLMRPGGLDNFQLGHVYALAEALKQIVDRPVPVAWTAPLDSIPADNG